jgi:Zn-finger nucleic acid-binding protein
MGDVVVEQCETCGGIWMDLGEMPAVIAYHRKQSKQGSLAESERAPLYDAITGPCPRCGGEGHMTRLTNLEDSSLIMDSCPVCYGIWLDGGELQKLMEHGANSGIRGLFRNLFGER